LPISGRSEGLARVFSGVLERQKRFWLVNSSLLTQILVN
jgi:hypothetical protein